MIHDLIWDVDGTIFDTYPAFARAVHTALVDLGGIAPLDRIDGLCRRSLGHCVATLASELELDADELTERFGLHYAAVPAQDQPLFPGVVEVCTYVRTIGGKNLIVTHRGRQSLQRLLAAHGMAEYFADCLTHDDGYPRKPDPTSFEEMIHRHHLAREEVLAIGDRDIDVLAGHAAGVRTCRFGLPSTAAVADYSVAEYAELYRILVAENEGRPPLVI